MNLSLLRRRFVLLSALSLAMFAAPLSAADGGPTPYPDAKDEAAWPGKGPIRLHGWMVDNRAAFWDQREKDQGAVVFAGDSLIGGWKPELMKKAFPNLKIANRGVGGDTSRGLLFRFKEDVLDLNPAAVVICIGSNDLSAHGDPAAVEANIAEMIEMARQHSATMPIVLCLTPPRDSKEAPTKPGAHPELNERIAQLAEGREHVALADTFNPMATPAGKPIPEYFGKDRVHITAAGFEKWGEVLRPVLHRLGVE
ncbi:MAG TPA: GDSL-type esterase/lipase family protein [Tepidisphaeraceae bacterium]|jgi:lysophospholipase L1-like esterase|nr:GDSL-type esterase/lipase family protein [Tepidisphaeraceae bacterium]